MTKTNFKSRSFIKPVTLLGAAAVLTLGLAGCSSGSANNSTITEASSEEKVKVLTVGIGNIIPPQFYVDDSGKLVGYDVEILQKIDELLPQYEFEYEQLDLAATLVALESGKIDIADWQFGKTAEREEKFLYPDEAYDIGVLKLITKADQTNLNTLSDMAGKTMAQMPTSSFYRYLAKYNEENPDAQITIETVDSLPVADALKMVDSGRIEGTLSLMGTYNKIISELDVDTRMGDTVDAYGVYHILAKGSTDLKKELDGAIKQMKEDGTLAELSQKWYGYDNFEEYQAFTGEQSLTK